MSVRLLTSSGTPPSSKILIKNWVKQVQGCVLQTSLPSFSVLSLNHFAFRWRHLYVWYRNFLQNAYHHLTSHWIYCGRLFLPSDKTKAYFGVQSDVYWIKSLLKYIYHLPLQFRIDSWVRGETETHLPLCYRWRNWRSTSPASLKNGSTGHGTINVMWKTDESDCVRLYGCQKLPHSAVIAWQREGLQRSTDEEPLTNNEVKAFGDLKRPFYFKTAGLIIPSSSHCNLITQLMACHQRLACQQQNIFLYTNSTAPVRCRGKSTCCPLSILAKMFRQSHPHTDL